MLPSRHPQLVLLGASSSEPMRISISLLPPLDAKSVDPQLGQNIRWSVELVH